MLGRLPPPMAPLQILHEGLTTLRGALDPYWLGLFVLPLLTRHRVRWAWVLARYRLRGLLRQLLDHPWGRWWPVLAAIVPGGIGFVSVLGKNWARTTQTTILATLLLAVAALQLYGQSRNNRDRIKTENQFFRNKIKTENQFLDLVDEIREGRKEAGDGRKEAEETATTIIAEIARCRAECKSLYGRIIQKLP
jgi:hypothetical protein